MINKHYLRSRKTCKVTFSLPDEMHAQTVAVVGDFNHWDRSATPMKQVDGSFVATVELECGHSYHFRYYINNKEWHNDEKADWYSVNPYGSMNCVISV
jgi:1,4-alpha-glucan branching enzyme